MCLSHHPAILSGMILSPKTLHAVRIMVDLVQQGRRTQLKYTAERVGISKKYAERLISELHAAGLVKSVRGRRGGYLQGRPADEISIGDIVRAVDEPHEESRYPRNKGFEKAFERVQAAIWESLDEVSLAEATKSQR